MILSIHSHSNKIEFYTLQLKKSLCKYEKSLLRQKARDDLEKFVGVMMKKITTSDLKNFVTEQYVQILEHTQHWLSREDGSCNEETFIALKNELAGCNALKLAKSVLEMKQASVNFSKKVKKMISD